MILRKLRNYLLFPITFILCVMTIMLSTPWGSEATIALVNKFSPLELTYRRGVLLESIEFSQGNLALKQLKISATDLKLHVDLRCSWKGQLCIDDVSATDLSIQQLTADTLKASEPITVNNADLSPKLNEQNSNTKLIELPFSININQLEVKSAKLDLAQATIKLNQLNSSIKVKKSSLLIRKSTVLAMDIKVKNPVEPLQQPADTTIFSIVNNLQPSDFYLPIQIKLAELASEKITIDTTELLSISDNWQHKHHLAKTVIGFEWENKQIHFKKLLTSYGELGELSASATIVLADKFPLMLNLTSKINTFPHWPSLENSEQKIQLSGNLQQLAIKLDSTGSLEMNASGHIQPLVANLPFEFNLNATKIPLDDLNHSDVRLLVKPSTIILNASGDLHQQTIDLEGIISGFGYDSAVIKLDTSHTNNSLAIRSFEFYDEQSASALTLAGKIDYLESFQWDVKIDSSGFTLPELYSDLHGRLAGTANSQGSLQDKHWHFALNDTNMRGNINNKNFQATGNINVNQNRQVSPSDFHASLGETTVNLSGYSDDNWHLKGDISAFQVKDWLSEGQGELTGLFEISGELAQPILTFNGKVKQISWRQLFGEEIAFESRYQFAQQELSALSIHSEELRWKDHYFYGVNSTFSTEDAKQSLQLNWQGESNLALSLQGQWLEDKTHWQGEIASASFGISPLQLHASSPIALDINTKSQQLLIGEHCWLADDIRLCLDKAANIGKSGELSLALRTELSLLNNLLPTENIKLDSSVSGNLELQWHDLLAPTLHAALTLGKGQASVLNIDKDQEVIQWQEGVFKLDSTSENIKSQLMLSKFQEQADSQENNLPSPLISAFIIMPMDAQNQLSGQIQLHQLNLQPVAHFFPELSSLAARVDADIKIAGTGVTPQLYGTLDIKESTIKLLRSSSVLDKINLHVKLNGTHSEITSDFLIGNDPVTARGKVEWKNNFSTELYIDADQVSLAFPPKLQATFSPHVKINVTKNNIKVTGDLDIVDGLLTLEKLPEGSIDVSKDVIIIDDFGQPIIKNKRLSSSVDLHITLAEEFKLIGQGYDGHIGGELQLRQENSQPIQLFGVLKLIDGKYKAYGQRLSIDKGVMSFNGPTSTPHIDLRATKKIEKEDVSVGVTLTGLTNALELKLFSTPNMPQSEILSYLVRGRGLDAETQGNTALGVALGTSLASASGVLKQFDKLPLINNVELDSTDEQLTIGGYIGDKIYVKYGIGLLEPINELQVRFYLLNRLWLEAVTGLERSAGIFYSFDIK